MFRVIYASLEKIKKLCKAIGYVLLIIENKGTNPLSTFSIITWSPVTFFILP